jgi:exosortase/archaeosortase family protein
MKFYISLPKKIIKMNAIEKISSYGIKLVKENVVSFIAMLVFLYLFIFGGWSFLSKSYLFETVILALSSLIGNLSILVIKLFGIESFYDAEFNNLIILGKEIVPVLSRLGIKFYILLIFVLLLFNRNFKKSIGLLFFGVSLLIALTVLRFSGEIILSSTWSFWVTNLVFYLRWILILFILASKGKEYPIFRETYNKIAAKTRERFSIPLYLIILLIPIFLKLNHLIDTNAYIISTEPLLQLILQISHSIMHLIGFPETVIQNGNCLYLGINYVCVGFPCLGLGIMTSFTLLILLIRSPWLNRISYILFGLGVMILMNSIRVVYLLIHLYKNQSYQLAMDAHDLSNYFFTLWFSFYFWGIFFGFSMFQYLLESGKWKEINVLFVIRYSLFV